MIQFNEKYGSNKTIETSDTPSTLGDYVFGLKKIGDSLVPVGFPVGVIAGDGVSTITMSDLWNLINTKAFGNATTYYITDFSDTDMGALFRSTANGTKIESSGIGYFLNADFQNNGDYTDAPTAFGTNRGVWFGMNEEGYSNGDVVIYNPEEGANLHYQVINASALNGSDPDSNGDAYAYLSIQDQASIGKKYGYILEADIIQYHFEDEYMITRSDKRGNVVNNWSLQTFQFGNDNVYDVVISVGECELWMINNAGTVTGTIMGDNIYIDITGNNGYVFFNVSGTQQYMIAPQNQDRIDVHLFGIGSGLQAYENSGEIKVYIYDNSFVIGDYNSGSIYGRYYDQSYVSHSHNSGNIQSCEFSNAFNGYITLNSGISHIQNKYSYNISIPSVFDPTMSYMNCVLSNTSSTFSVNVDITGGGTITVPNNYCGVYRLTSSNETETFDSIINNIQSSDDTKDAFEVILKPVGALVVTMTAAFRGSVSTNQILYQNNLNLVGDADYNKCDYITIMRHNDINRVVRTSIITD